MQSNGTADWLVFWVRNHKKCFLWEKPRRKYFLWVFPTKIEEEMMQSNQIKSNQMELLIDLISGSEILTKYILLSCANSEIDLNL